MIINPGHLILTQTANDYARRMRERAEMKRAKYGAFLSQRAEPTVCVCCGSSEFRLHGLRHVCAYCRTSSARSRA